MQVTTKQIAEMSYQHDRELSGFGQGEGTYLVGEEIPNCPKCGSRSDFEQIGENFQMHTCLNKAWCSNEWITEFETEEL